ncbi:hypothetical protein HMI54_011717 [Coelomomyces lativittatus]|nr:hypothetical protein HMI54_011717 [Coelomomyces lativittatus]
MWLHKIDDRPPTHPEINAKPYPWIQPMMANPTSTSSAFKTFSTVPPKIQAWVPHLLEIKLNYFTFEFQRTLSLQR